MPEVRLSKAEMMMAGYIGVMRHCNNIFNPNIKNIFENDNDAPWERDVVAAQCELAAARHFKLYWSGMRMDKPADVGDMIEVRGVTSEKDRLLVRPRDNDKLKFPFVSVLHVKENLFVLRGWMFGHDVKSEGRQLDPDGKPFWVVDNDKLHPIERLEQWIAREMFTSL